MFDLFLALFGGLYYGGKRAGEKTRVSEIKKQNAEINQIKTQIMCNSYRNNIHLDCPKTMSERWIMAESIKEDLEYIFGKRWRNFLINGENFHNIGQPARRSKYRFDNPWQIAYEVWVSSKGYIDERVRLDIKYSVNALSFGVDADPQQCGEPWCTEPLTNTDEGRNIRLRACQIIERNLQAHHPDISQGLRLLQYKAPDNECKAYDKLLVWAFDILGKDAIPVW